MKEKVFTRGEIIFREGDSGESFFQIREGTAGVYLRYGEENQQKLTDMTAGQFFGEMGLLLDEPRSATAVVEEDNTLLECIRKEDLETLYRENPVKVYMIVSHLSHRLRQLTREYVRACAVAAGEEV